MRIHFGVIVTTVLHTWILLGDIQLILGAPWKECTTSIKKELKKNNSLVKVHPYKGRMGDGWPCLNGGTCLFAPARLDKKPTTAFSLIISLDDKNVKCLCPSGLIGQFCDKATCEPNPCQNGGTCETVRFPVPGLAPDEDVECSCLDEYTGKYCEDEFKGTIEKMLPCKTGSKLKGDVNCIHGKCIKRDAVVDGLHAILKNITGTNTFLLSMAMDLSNIEPKVRTVEACWCKSGYTDFYCHEPCNYSYHEYCKTPCGFCAKSKPCDHKTGKCKKCQEGYAMPYCQECKKNLWGPKCKTQCGSCKEKTCDTTTGKCAGGCAQGYETKYCNVQSLSPGDKDDLLEAAGEAWMNLAPGYKGYEVWGSLQDQYTGPVQLSLESKTGFSFGDDDERRRRAPITSKDTAKNIIEGLSKMMTIAAKTTMGSRASPTAKFGLDMEFSIVDSKATAKRQAGASTLQAD